MATRKKRKLPRVEFRNTNEVERSTSSFRDIGLILFALYVILWIGALI